MKWEVIWVASVETVNYIVQLCTGSMRVDLGGGRRFPWSRYVAWQLTCPVLLSFIVTSVLKKKNVRINIQVLMLLQFILLSGMTASLLVDMSMKIMFVCMASFGFLYLDYYLFSNRPTDKTREKSTHLLVFFTSSWTLFPILFILGPEMTGVMPFEYTLIGHAIGDLISKNLFGILAWNYLKHMESVSPKKKKKPKVRGPQAPTPSEISTPRRTAWVSEAVRDIEAGTALPPLTIKLDQKSDQPEEYESSSGSEEETEDNNPTETSSPGEEPRLANARLMELEKRFSILMAEREKYMKTHLALGGSFVANLPLGLQMRENPLM